MYTIDINVSEPIMLINKQIGPSYNDDGTFDGQPYVDGAEFQEELLRLDSLGKKRIQVWINSFGGSVSHAMNIYSAILKSNTPVDTYNVGVCASSAGVIFMAGRKRYAYDYSKFMMHPVSGGAGDKDRAAIQDAVAGMLGGKANIDSIMINYMMERTTWLSADECKSHGIANEVLYTKDENKKYMPLSDHVAMYDYCNTLLTKTEKMDYTKIANKLQLVAEANEDTILREIEKLRNQATEAQNEAQTVKDELAQAEAKLTEAQSELDEAKAKLAETEAAELAAKEALAETQATELVNKHIDRIGNDASVIAKWVNMAKIDMDGTRELIESIPLNKKAPEAVAVETVGKLTAASVMAQIENKFKNKQK